MANAIGASIAQVSGEAEGLLVVGAQTRDEALKALTVEAERLAVVAGADPKSVVPINIEEVDIPYMATETTRIRITVVGDLAQNEPPSR